MLVTIGLGSDPDGLLGNSVGRGPGVGLRSPLVGDMVDEEPLFLVGAGLGSAVSLSLGWSNGDIVCRCSGERVGSG